MACNNFEQEMIEHAFDCMHAFPRMTFRVVDMHFLMNENLLDDSVKHLFLLLRVFTILLPECKLIDYFIPFSRVNASANIL